MGTRRNAQESVPAGGRLVSRTRRLDDAPLSALVRAAERPHAIWTAPNEPAVLARGAAAFVTASGTDRFASVREQAATVFSSIDRPDAAPHVARPRFVGGFSFHDRHDATGVWDGFPGAGFVLPHVQFTVTDDATYLTVNEYGADATPASVERTLDKVAAAARDTTHGDLAAPPGVRRTERTTDRETWRDQVEQVVERIESGTLEKAVLAQSLRAELDGAFSLPDAFDRLADAYPDCFRFAFRANGGRTFFGATPERLVTRHGGRLETGALASTAPRGDTPAEDDALEADLRNSEKYQHEHQLVADSIRDQLDGHARNVATGDQQVRKLTNVQHLFTPISADTDDHVLALADALHPTPAVGGLPPAAALDAIREIETFDRGWYAAPVGWFDADGDGTFAVALRSAVADDGAATLFAGNGIVADSDPDTEWEEVLLKYRPILDALE
ncbi:isochorismate synthase [Salarchaeum japonicum]|uniref:isochorismate synthase n=1 Tax=Salarchaeum japonicum TaxID=555573 RepID=A0AAV3T2R5_9EURY|nr:isochorismate synthase [Salarchaeum japonicum]